MYTVAFRGTAFAYDDVVEVCVDYVGLRVLVNVLERAKVRFKVANRLGPLSHAVFDRGPSEYWLGPNDQL